MTIGPVRGIFVMSRDPALIKDAMGDRSYRAVAAAVGVSATTVYNLATGTERLTTPARAAAFEKALGKRPGELFGVACADAALLRPFVRHPVAAAG